MYFRSIYCFQGWVGLIFLFRKQDEEICLMAEFDVEFPYHYNGLQSSLIAFIFKNISLPMQCATEVAM